MAHESDGLGGDGVGRCPGSRTRQGFGGTGVRSAPPWVDGRTGDDTTPVRQSSQVPGIRPTARLLMGAEYGVSATHQASRSVPILAWGLSLLWESRAPLRAPYAPSGLLTLPTGPSDALPVLSYRTRQLGGRNLNRLQNLHSPVRIRAVPPTSVPVDRLDRDTAPACAGSGRCGRRAQPRSALPYCEAPVSEPSAACRPVCQGPHGPGVACARAAG